MRKLNYEYRVVWRRKGDKSDRQRVFDSSIRLYRFVVRMATMTPWRGAGKRVMYGITFCLARQLKVPTATFVHKPLREVFVALSQSHKPFEFLRVEARQVMPWHEVADPLKVLRPERQDKFDANAEAFCDYLDANPDKRWLSPEERRAEVAKTLAAQASLRGTV